MTEASAEHEPLVSVVIPAYNAQFFIERTLLSVLAQSHRNIEVIVVDDGSDDATLSIVERFSQQDERVKVIRQDNRGVASARNTGLMASKGRFVAPIDADDVWHSSKLEKQLSVFASDTHDLGLVYSLYRTIDKDDILISTPKRSSPSGWIFMQHLGQNFIGNGSSPMFRREVLLEMGGYSSRLKEDGAQGCEDFLLQLAIASKYRFGVVREHLVGYRRTPGNMSRDFVRMLISRRMVLEGFLQRGTDEVRAVILTIMFRNDVEIARLGLKTKRFGAVARNCGKLLFRSPAQFVRLISEFGAIALRRMRGVNPVNEVFTDQLGKSFWDYDPKEFVNSGENPDTRSLLDRLARIDARLGPLGAYLKESPESGTIVTTLGEQTSEKRTLIMV